MTSIPVEAPIVDDAILKISGTGALRACLLNNRRPICATVAGDGLGGSEGQRQGERQEEPADEEAGNGSHGLEGSKEEEGGRSSFSCKIWVCPILFLLLLPLGSHGVFRDTAGWPREIRKIGEDWVRGQGVTEGSSLRNLRPF